MSNKISTEVKCSDCGKTTTVPFKPNAAKPVYCRTCLSKHREDRPRTENRFETKRLSVDTESQAWSRRRSNWK